uniref:Uncharacterized protein n=1 Tax=Octactis speculum TaxID=3111310 RepID=A0A7S2DM09_9STRA|mmetsp:Transcript_50920/g.69324  ORF Transcript_50920/g.69324 Transcript_50920/m.69324 type:complete len:331 (+) Transcript_50920:98-1090(+)
MSTQVITLAEQVDTQEIPLATNTNESSKEECNESSIGITYHSDEKLAGYYDGLAPDVDLTSDYFYEEVEVKSGAITEFLGGKEEHREGSQYYMGEQKESVVNECVVEEGKWTYKVTNAKRFILLKQDPAVDAELLQPKIKFKNGHVFHVTKRITVSRERDDGGEQTYLEADKFGGWIVKFHQTNGKAFVEEFEGFSYYEPAPTFDEVEGSIIEYNSDVEFQEPFSDSDPDPETEEPDIETQWACSCCPGALNETSCSFCGPCGNEYCFPTWETVYCLVTTNKATNEPVERKKLESGEKPEEDDEDDEDDGLDIQIDFHISFKTKKKKHKK